MNDDPAPTNPTRPPMPWKHKAAIAAAAIGLLLIAGIVGAALSRGPTPPAPIVTNQGHATSTTPLLNESMPPLSTPATTTSIAPGGFFDAEYYCSHSVRNGVSTPCDNTATALTLTKRGTWSSDLYAGTYTVQGTAITFNGGSAYQGPPSWGEGGIIAHGITFTTAQKTSYWMMSYRDDPTPIAGTYVCDCSSTAQLTVVRDGTWTYGHGYGGELTYADGDVVFRACCSYDGPSTWGPAHVGSRTLTFHFGTNSPTVYRMSG